MTSSQLAAKRTPPPGMKVTLCTLSGHKYALDVTPEMTILEVKEKLAHMLDGRPAELVNLSYKGKTLSDEKTLRSYAIRARVELQLELPLARPSLQVLYGGKKVHLEPEDWYITFSALKDLIAEETGMPVEYQQLFLDGEYQEPLPDHSEPSYQCYDTELHLLDGRKPPFSKEEGNASAAWMDMGLALVVGAVGSWIIFGPLNSASTTAGY